MNSKVNLQTEVKNFINEIEKFAIKPIYELTPTEAREFLLNLQRKTPVHIEANIEDRILITEKAGNVDIRIVKPLNYKNLLPAVVYAHGGGWVMGDKEVYDTLIRKIATDSNCAVIFVNYGRSPENIYPKAIDEIYSVIEYVSTYPDEFDIDPKKIVIAGDSAGGNMAAACTIKAKTGPKINGQILIYPVTDASMSSESYKDFENGPWLSKKAMEYFWDSYVPEKAQRNNPLISPIDAEFELLKGLPPTLIITSENDVLRDEGENYAKKLNLADVKVSNIRINGTIHDFLMLNGLFYNIQTKATFSIIKSTLTKLFNY